MLKQTTNQNMNEFDEIKREKQMLLVQFNERHRE